MSAKRSRAGSIDALAAVAAASAATRGDDGGTESKAERKVTPAEKRARRETRTCERKKSNSSASRAPLIVAKTDAGVRRKAIASLRTASWVRWLRVTFENLAEAEAILAEKKVFVLPDILAKGSWADARGS